MMGKDDYVRYKDGIDKKEYIVVDYSGIKKNAVEEICILVDFPFYPNRIKQLRIWQNLNKFIILCER